MIGFTIRIGGLTRPEQSVMRMGPGQRRRASGRECDGSFESAEREQRRAPRLTHPYQPTLIPFDPQS
jgi:hypothetical protein